MGNLLARDLGGMVEVDPNEPFSRTRRLSAHAESLPAPGSIHDTFGYFGTTSKLATFTSGAIDHPLGYDAAGNETRYLATRTYSPRNLMSSIAEDSEDNRPHTITYSYDGRGVRLIRSEGTVGYSAPFATRYYTYSPELQLLAVSTDDNPNIWGKTAIANSVPAMKHEIAWFNGRPIAERVDGADVRYTFTDHLGTPILQTDPTAAIAWRAEYEPYGDMWTLRVGSSPAEQPLRFPGQEYAGRWEGVEERYNIFRWYRSGWGRYTQADPLSRHQEHYESILGDIVASVHLYAYADDRPTVQTDRSGLGAEGVLTIPGVGPAVATGVLAVAACILNPECRRQVRCAAEFLKDTARCTRLGLCDTTSNDPLHNARVESCLIRSWLNWRACSTGWPRPYPDPWPGPKFRGPRTPSEPPEPPIPTLADPPVAAFGSH